MVKLGILKVEGTRNQHTRAFSSAPCVFLVTITKQV